MSSRQLRTYLALRADGLSREDAAFEAGIGVEEARLTDIAASRGEIDAPPPITTGEDEMAKRKSAAPAQDNEQVATPDFEKAVRIYRQDIKPAVEAAGERAQEASTGYKAIKKDCRVNTRAARFVFSLERESEEKRNDILRSVRGMLDEMDIGITDDLVSQAENEDRAAPIIPTAAPEKLQVATIQ
jgi:hypothetical protein